jgi:hypothetical protein
MYKVQPKDKIMPESVILIHKLKYTSYSGEAENYVTGCYLNHMRRYLTYIYTCIEFP